MKIYECFDIWFDSLETMLILGVSIDRYLRLLALGHLKSNGTSRTGSPPVVGFHTFWDIAECISKCEIENFGLTVSYSLESVILETIDEIYTSFEIEPDDPIGETESWFAKCRLEEYRRGFSSLSGNGGEVTHNQIVASVILSIETAHTSIKSYIEMTRNANSESVAAMFRTKFADLHA